MKRLAIIFAAVVALLGVAVPAHATTGCQATAPAPNITSVDNGVGTLQGHGQVAGCAFSIPSHHIDVTVTLVHDGATVATGTASSTWSRYVAFRAAAVTLTTVCQPGEWHVHVTWVQSWDGFNGSFDSPSATFAVSDETCGSYGGA